MSLTYSQHLEPLGQLPDDQPVDVLPVVDHEHGVAIGDLGQHLLRAVGVDAGLGPVVNYPDHFCRAYMNKKKKDFQMSILYILIQVLYMQAQPNLHLQSNNCPSWRPIQSPILCFPGFFYTLIESKFMKDEELLLQHFKRIWLYTEGWL